MFLLVRESVSIVTKCRRKHTSQFKPRQTIVIPQRSLRDISGMNIMQNSEGPKMLFIKVCQLSFTVFLRVVYEELHSSSGPFTRFHIALKQAPAPTKTLSQNTETSPFVSVLSL